MEVEAGAFSVVMRVRGDLDAASAPQLDAAVWWLRRRSCALTLDLQAVTFVDLAGLRSAQRAAIDPLGRPDPRVSVIGGPALDTALRQLARVVHPARGVPRLSSGAAS